MNDSNQFDQSTEPFIFGKPKFDDNHKPKKHMRKYVHDIVKIVIGFAMVMLSMLGIKAYRTENQSTVSWFKCLTMLFNLVLSFH